MLDRNVNNNLKANQANRHPAHHAINDGMRLGPSIALAIPHAIAMGLAAWWFHNYYNVPLYNNGVPLIDTGLSGLLVYQLPLWVLLGFLTAWATFIFDLVSVLGHHPNDGFYARQNHQYDGLLALIFSHVKTLVFHAVSLGLATLAMIAGLIELGFACEQIRQRPDDTATSRLKALEAFAIIAGAFSFFHWLLKVLALRIYNDTPYVSEFTSAQSNGYAANNQGAYANNQGAYANQQQQQYGVINQNPPIVP